MLQDDTLKRFDRIVHILIQLQSKRIIKAQDIANRFGISLRTVYRDIKTLEAAGVPIYSEAGVGYSLLDGYRLPPVLFTKEEATSFIAAERLMQRFSDNTLKMHFQSAIYKIKAVLRSGEKDWLAHLEERVQMSYKGMPPVSTAPEVLATLFNSLAQQYQIKALYLSLESDEPQWRHLEPVQAFYEYDQWYVKAYCHKRQAYRNFRTDRFIEVHRTDKPFTHKHTKMRDKSSIHHHYNEHVESIIIRVSHQVARYLSAKRHLYGYVNELKSDYCTDIQFLTDYRKSGFDRWFLSFADSAEILEPETFRLHIQELVNKIQQKLIKPN